MSPAPTFSAQLLGQTEKAANAILDRLLARPGLTEHQWIALSLTIASDAPVDIHHLVEQVANAVHISEAQARAAIHELRGARLLDVPDGEGAPVSVTDAGLRLHTGIRGEVSEITDRLWGDLPSADLAAAARVLSIVLERATALEKKL